MNTLPRSPAGVKLERQVLGVGYEVVTVIDKPWYWMRAYQS